MSNTLHDDMLFEQLDGLYPGFPIDTSYTADLIRLMAENPGLPVLFFADGVNLPTGAFGHCSFVRVELIEYLDARTPWSIACVEHNREAFTRLIEDQLVRYPQDHAFSSGDLATWAHATARTEAAKWDAFWKPAIGVFVAAE